MNEKTTAAKRSAQNSKLRDFSPFPYLARIFKRINPNAISVFGVGLAYVGSAIKAIPEINSGEKATAWAIGLLASALACDGLDGAVARLKGERTENEEINGALVDLYSDRLQESGMAIFRIIAAMNRKDPFGVVAATLSGATGPMPSYVRAKAEVLGYHPPEFSLGTRLPRFFSASAATVYPEQPLLFGIPTQLTLDALSTVTNVFTTVQRIKYLQKIKKGVIKDDIDLDAIKKGKIKTKGLGIYNGANMVVMGVVGFYGLVNSFR